MTSTTNPYASGPAIPVLATSLLSLSKSSPKSQDQGAIFVSESRNSVWDLKTDIDNGLQPCISGVFRYGTIIGFSKLRDRSTESLGDEFIGELPRCLLTKWLCRAPPTPNPKTRAYIIHPASFNAFSPKKLLMSLLSTPCPAALSRQEAISYLDSVRLFPVFDFPAAVQAINEVSETIHVTSQDRQFEEAELTPDADGSTVLIIAGLDTLAEGVIRASNAVRGAAVLTTALRTVTQLSRMHGSYLSIMLVGTSGVGPLIHENLKAPHNLRRGDDSTLVGQDGGIYSAFGTTDAFLFPSFLMKTFDQGIDTHILLSNSRSLPVVEVIKDRIGDSLGKWTVLGRRN